MARPRGSINYATAYMKEDWHEFFSSEAFRSKTRQDILAGNAAPGLLVYLLSMVYGKPKENVDVNVSVSQVTEMSGLSIEELAQRAEELQKQLEDARALEAAIPAEYRVEEEKAVGE